MVAGKGVASSGALETVMHGKTGLHFAEQTPQCISATLDAFEANTMRFDFGAIRAHAETFATPVFKAKFKAMVERTLNRGGARPQPGAASR